MKNNSQGHQFGMIDLSKESFHKGFIKTDGEMGFEKRGIPTKVPKEIVNPPVDRIGTVSSWVEGPRWAGFASYIRKSAIHHNLTVLSLDEDKGWIRSTVFYKLEGYESDLAAFKKCFARDLEEYNKD